VRAAREAPARVAPVRDATKSRRSTNEGTRQGSAQTDSLQHPAGVGTRDRVRIARNVIVTFQRTLRIPDDGHEQTAVVGRDEPQEDALEIGIRRPVDHWDRWLGR